MARKGCDGLDEINAGIRLEEISSCTGLEQLLNELFVVVHCENQDLRLWQAQADLARHFQAVHQWQRIVEDANIRLRRDGLGDSILSVARFSDDLPIRLALQNLQKAKPHDFMIVGD
jgi:hypothetical protein